MYRLVPVLSESDILSVHHNTPFEKLLKFHNLNNPLEKFDKPEIIIGTCMDHRVYLKIPEQFAYIVRTPGANMRHAQFGVSFAIAMAGIKYLAIIGHTDCGMRELTGKQDTIEHGLVQHAGWNEKNAKEHFHQCLPNFEIGDEIDFVVKESARMNELYPKIMVVPMIYRVEDNRLSQVIEYHSKISGIAPCI